MCVFFSHAYASSSDDPDFFKNRYQYSNWSHDKVTPYNTAGSTQNDYYNSEKYNVNSSRDVTSNGSKYKQTVNVAVEASKAEKVATIANRAKNMAEYAKKFGKASLPAFVGSAALTALINGVGWVIDDGGKVSRIPTANDPDPAMEQCTASNNNCSWSPTLYWDGSWAPYARFASAYAAAKNAQNVAGRQGELTYSDGWWRINGNIFVGVLSSSNPNYLAGTNAPAQDFIEVPLDELSQLLQKAMDKSLADNNKPLADAVAQAIKDAFSESDLDKNPNTGEKSNPIAEKTKKALDEKGATDIAEDADPTVCVPNIGDLEGSCTNMPKSEADALPTLQCVNRPIVSANSCVYEVDPNAPTKPGTIEKPKVNPETGDLPDACVWFDVHCKWLEWTKEDDLSDDTELDLDTKNEPEANTEISFDGLCPANKSILLPAPFNFEMTFTYEPYCLVAEKIKPAVVACGLFISALILGGIKGSY